MDPRAVRLRDSTVQSRKVKIYARESTRRDLSHGEFCKQGITGVLVRMRDSVHGMFINFGVETNRFTPTPS